MNCGLDGHARTKFVQIFLTAFEADSHGKPLNDLHVIAGSVFGRKHAGARTSDGRHAFHGAIEIAMKGVNINSDTLAGMNAG